MHADILARFHSHVTAAMTDILFLAAQLRPRPLTPQNGDHALLSPQGRPATPARPGAAGEKGDALATLHLEGERKKRKRKEKKERRELAAVRGTAERKEATTPHKCGSPQKMAARAPARLPLIGEQFPPLALCVFLLAAASRPAPGRCPPPPLRALGTLSPLGALRAPRTLRSLSPLSPSAQDGGSWRRSWLPARAGFGAGQRRRHLPPR